MKLSGASQGVYYKLTSLTATVKARYDSLGVAYHGSPQGTNGFETSASGKINTPQLYFYHADHLGISSLITDNNGLLVQHLQYLPFGEVFIDERKGSWHTPFTFSAKEQDEETGLHFFGARYYNSRTSVWLSVDLLAEKFAGWSAYNYCKNNPVNRFDPDGRADENTSGKPSEINKTNGSYTAAQSTTYLPAKIELTPLQQTEQLKQKLLAEKQKLNKGTLTQAPSNYEKAMNTLSSPEDRAIAKNQVVQGAVVVAVAPEIVASAKSAAVWIEVSPKVAIVAGLLEGYVKSKIENSPPDLPSISDNMKFQLSSNAYGGLKQIKSILFPNSKQDDKKK